MTTHQAAPAELFGKARLGDASHIVFMDEALEVVPNIWQLLAEINFRLRGTDAFTINCTGLEEVYGVPKDARDTDRWPSWLLVMPRPMFERLPVEHLQYRTLEFAWLELAELCRVRIRIIGERVSLFEPFRWAADRMLDAKEDFAHDYRWYQVYQRPVERVPPQFRVTTNYEAATLAPAPGDTHKISVICPVFKSAFITQLVDSICRQTYDNWELRLGVDGPPQAELDRIRTQIAAFPDPRIHTFIQENKGTGPTRQRLAEEATGDFIVTIDDDDMLMPDALSTFARAISGTPEGNVFRGGARLVGLADMKMPQNKRYLINGIASDPFEATQPYAIRRDVLLGMGGYEWDASIYNAGEDTMLFHRLDQRGEPVYLIPEVLYLRRLSTQNLTLFFRPQDALGHFKNLDAHFCPEGWKNTGRTFELDEAADDTEIQGIQMSGHFQRALAVYQHDEIPGRVVTATRFYQYQTLGDVSHFVVDLALHAGSLPPYKTSPGTGENDTGELSLETVRSLARVTAGGPRRTIVMSGTAPDGLPERLMEMITMLRGAGQRP
ncbi:MAG: glycosyltransferase, partial [Saprospiraceae bacterium]|nr:glycosyltransferase [Saprospiraceae bacterium]